MEATTFEVGTTYYDKHNIYPIKVTRVTTNFVEDTLSNGEQATLGKALLLPTIEQAIQCVIAFHQLFIVCRIRFAIRYKKFFVSNTFNKFGMYPNPPLFAYKMIQY